MSVKAAIKKIREEIGTRSLFAVFDRDGTLVPFKPDPEKAILDPSIKNLLIDLSKRAKTLVAILSARDLQRLEKDFDKQELILAGNYGMEISFPNQPSFINQKATSCRPQLLMAKQVLESKLPSESRTILEDHGLTLCLHWHHTPAKYLDLVHNTIHELKSSLPGLIYRKLPTSYEIWPFLQWDKANGLDEIERKLLIDRQEHLPLYVGDSSSDEPAFKWVNERQGITLHIGSDLNSEAQFHIESPERIPEFLQDLIEIVRTRD